MTDSRTNQLSDGSFFRITTQENYTSQSKVQFKFLYDIVIQIINNYINKTTQSIKTNTDRYKIKDFSTFTHTICSIILIHATTLQIHPQLSLSLHPYSTQTQDISYQPSTWNPPLSAPHPTNQATQSETQIRLVYSQIWIKALHINTRFAMINSNLNHNYLRECKRLQCKTPIYGGGNQPKQKHTLHPQPKQPMQRQDNWISLLQTIIQINDSNNLITQTNTEHQWRPAEPLPYRMTDHQLIKYIPATFFNKIKALCQMDSDTPIIRLTTNPLVHITTNDMQNLISYGQEINDETMSVYIEILCYKYNIASLYTDWYTRLCQHGWQDLIRYFCDNPDRNRPRSSHRPRRTGEGAIMLPIHIHGCHWIALV
jgi:hypothetical protein